MSGQGKVTLQPMPLNSMAAICRVFCKSRRTVRKWYEAGAPISFDGDAYSSEYNILRVWLNERYSHAGCRRS